MKKEELDWVQKLCENAPDPGPMPEAKSVGHIQMTMAALAGMSLDSLVAMRQRKWAKEKMRHQLAELVWKRISEEDRLTDEEARSVELEMLMSMSFLVLHDAQDDGGTMGAVPGMKEFCER